MILRSTICSRAIIQTESTVSCGDSITMEVKTITMVSRELKKLGMLWEMTWRRVSVSFVYMDMMSPCAWVSK